MAVINPNTERNGRRQCHEKGILWLVQGCLSKRHLGHESEGAKVHGDEVGHVHRKLPRQR